MAGINLNVGNYFGTSASGVNTLFGSLNTSGVSSLANLASDYSSIRSGAYGKLVKSYYKQPAEDTTNKTNNKDKTKDDAATKKNTALSNVKSAAGSLQNTAKKLTAVGKDSLFEKKTVTSEDGKKIEEVDKDAIYGAVSDFVKSYNNVMDAAKDSGKSSIKNSADSITSLTNTMSKSLSNVGITVDNDGKLSVDEDKFKAADMNKVKSLFNGQASFAGSVASTASIMATTASNAMGMSNGAMYNNFGAYGDSYAYSGSLYANYF